MRVVRNFVRDDDDDDNEVNVNWVFIVYSGFYIDFYLIVINN